MCWCVLRRVVACVDVCSSRLGFTICPVSCLTGVCLALVCAELSCDTLARVLLFLSVAMAGVAEVQVEEVLLGSDEEGPFASDEEEEAQVG